MQNGLIIDTVQSFYPVQADGDHRLYQTCKI